MNLRLQKARTLALRPNRPQSRSEQLAEREAAEQGVLLREVDDALRQDEMLGAFRRFGLPAAALVLVGLLGLGGYLWWDHAANQEAARRGEEFTIALDQVEAGNLAAGDAKLKALIASGTESGDDGSQVAARIMRAGLAVEQGRRAEAAKLFAAVAASAQAPQPYRDLATVREVALTFDTLKPEDVVARLKPLAVPGNPWFGSAGELLGVAYLKQGKADLAGPLFASISRDTNVPETLRRRARQMAGLLGVDAIDDAAKAAQSPAG